jgi:hypothetical protein
MTKRSWSASSWENENLDLVELIKDIPADANIAYVFSLNHDAYVGSFSCCITLICLMNGQWLHVPTAETKKSFTSFFKRDTMTMTTVLGDIKKSCSFQNQWTSLGERKSPRFLS